MLKAIVDEGDRIGAPAGLVDGGHTYIKCSSCQKILVDIWHTQPNLIDTTTGEPFETEVIAHCDYCGDYSFKTKLYGGYHWGGYALPHPEDPEADFPQTVIDIIKEDAQGVTHLYTKKVKR